MKAHHWLSSAVLVLALTGASFATRAQQDDKKDKPEEHKAEEHKAAPAHQQAPAQEHHQSAQQQQQHRAAPAEEHHAAPQQEHRTEPTAQQQHRTEPAPQQQHAAPKQEERPAPAQEEHRAEHAPTPRPAPAQSNESRASRTSRTPQAEQPHPTTDREQHARLPEAQQQQRIAQQQQRVTQYRARLNSQQQVAQRYEAELQQQHRTHEYQFAQNYWARENAQRAALAQQYNYANNPYFYSAPIYRYNRGGQYYQINQYEADQLRGAINNGYDQGYRMGVADREDGFRGGFQNSFAYQDANYGWDGYSGDESSYNYYFRQGFSRGYDDGFANTFRYGAYNGGSYSLLGNVLNTIFNLQNLR